MRSEARLTAEWLEADGLGGFASGTVGGWRTRRYHGLLMAAVMPPSGRALLLAGLEAYLETPVERFALSAQRFAPGVTAPDGTAFLTAFETEPWPTWSWSLPGGIRVCHELFLPHEIPATVLRWRVTGASAGSRLHVRPFLAGRDSHALHYENPAFSFDVAGKGERRAWQPYTSMPPVHSLANADYLHEAHWYRDFLLEEERARGFEHLESFGTPGILSWDVTSEDAVWVVSAGGLPGTESLETGKALTIANRLRDRELRRRNSFASPLHRAADAYIVARGTGKTIIAGYPWFTDWGRDTFIALRGLCLTVGRLDDARAILLEWAGAVSEGMLPNRFVEQGDAPEFNAVDASLWYVIGVHEFMEEMAAAKRRISPSDRGRLFAAVDAILAGYAGGTRFGIGMDEDGLLRAGIPGVQLTWMDARIGDWVVTPRIGKPVEVQALWLNALRIGALRDPRWVGIHGRASASFRERFWNDGTGCLYDVVDCDHVSGTVDPSIRPNQLFAVGGLPFPVLEGPLARQIVDRVEAALWTPLGPRSLAPGSDDYAPHYAGGPRERDGAYHQGTVWPWLAGPFIEAWVRVRGGGPEVIQSARSRFLDPLMEHLKDAGLGHVSEIADADIPHTPAGCPFQAWSVGELLRMDRMLQVAPEGEQLRRAIAGGRPA